jgi:glycosyltransferase involved in cell wall biosynthesis
LLTIAYFANQFPSAVEPYVGDEIRELRRRGLRVIAGSARRPQGERSSTAEKNKDTLTLQPLRSPLLLRAALLCLRRRRSIQDLVKRLLLAGHESPLQRAKGLLQTLLGAYYAVLLEEYRVEHIHVHHGYFGSWIAMVAARLLDVGFSITLHGSDLLLHGLYLDTKLENCRFCCTVSEYNRQYILKHYPGIAAEKIIVARLGVEVPESAEFPKLQTIRQKIRPTLSLLSVGRLHPVKNHAFLVRACAQLREIGSDFECWIAGDGSERGTLQRLIREYGLEHHVTLLGHVPREQMASLYERADVVVLTSRSEGIPLALMEAMAHGNIVVAPAITGIPELVIPGKTGFLYKPQSLEDFVDQLRSIHSQFKPQGRCDPRSHILLPTTQLDWVRHGAKVQVRNNFDRKTNLNSFAEMFIARLGARNRGIHHHESPVLQQIQLSVQRH